MSGGEPARPGERLADIRVPARAASLREVRLALRAALSEAGAGELVVHDVVLAVDEACQNVIRHAYGGDTERTMELEVRRDGPNILLYLMDFADPVNVAKIQPRDLGDVRPGGLGVHFIREVMDEVEYGHLADGEGNLLRMVKRLA